MHYEHFQEAGVIYSTFNLKYNHKIISIGRHYNLLYRDATLYNVTRTRKIQFNSICSYNGKLTSEVGYCH